MGKTFRELLNEELTSLFAKHTKISSVISTTVVLHYYFFIVDVKCLRPTTLEDFKIRMSNRSTSLFLFNLFIVCWSIRSNLGK